MRVGFYYVDVGENVKRNRTLAETTIASVKRWMPSVEVVQFTGDRTAPIGRVDDVVRLESAPLALACLKAYAAAGQGEWLFIDTDVIVQRDVRWIFNDDEFDVAVATREGTLREKELGTKLMESMPYNKGAVFSRNPQFWTTCVEHAKRQSAKRQAWMGDQQAMNDVIAADGFRVRVLHARYNYPPFRRDEDLTDKAILHFKGPRKDWMLERVA